VLLSVQDDPDIPSRRWRLNAFLTHVLVFQVGCSKRYATRMPIEW
jgi:hypothetical protein